MIQAKIKPTEYQTLVATEGLRHEQQQSADFDKQQHAKVQTTIEKSGVKKKPFKTKSCDFNKKSGEK
jgi:hypothetical protein